MMTQDLTNQNVINNTRDGQADSAESMVNNKGLYIHIPFCVRKCPYCDFYSVEDLGLKARFIRALLKEIKLKSCFTHKIDTIYFGGGTPSLLDFNEVEKIINSVCKHFNIMNNTQITMEINPGTVNKDYFTKVKKIGVNRINIGVQSFQDAKLRFLNRIHSADKAKKAIFEARNSGFDNIGIDLMYGLPGELKDSWLDDIDSALNFSPEHLSCYMLTYEPETVMYNELEKGNIEPLDDKKVSSLFITTSQYLQKKGYFHYEISNFASMPEYMSRHNKKYWEMVPYLGLGPSAHSFDMNENDLNSQYTRAWNHADVIQYMINLETGKSGLMEQEVLTQEQILTELIMLGLRTQNGVDIKKFEAISGQSFISSFYNIIQDLQKKSWGKINNDKLVLTLEGMVYLDTIVSYFANEILEP